MPFDIISIGDNRYNIILIKLQMVTNRYTATFSRHRSSCKISPKMENKGNRI